MGGKARKNPVSSQVIADARINWEGLKVFIKEHDHTVPAVWNNLFSDLDEYPELDADVRIHWTTGWFSGVAEVYNMEPEEFLERYVLSAIQFALATTRIGPL